MLCFVLWQSPGEVQHVATRTTSFLAIQEAYMKISPLLSHAGGLLRAGAPLILDETRKMLDYDLELSYV